MKAQQMSLFDCSEEENGMQTLCNTSIVPRCSIDIRIGDCVEAMKELPDSVVDLVVTSPPYDHLRDYNGNGQDWCFDKFKSVAKELYRVCTGGVIVWVVADATVNGSETGTSFRQALYFMECGFRLHDTMIFRKNNYIPLTHNRYEQAFEYMFVFSKGKPKTFNPIMIPCKGAGKIESYGSKRRRLIDNNQAMRVPDGIEYKQTKSEKISPNIFSYSLGNAKTGHPAAFPDQLPIDMILSWSNESDTVLDPFMGSGTTGMACKKTGRNFIGIEIDKDYFSIAEKRLRF